MNKIKTVLISLGLMAGLAFSVAPSVMALDICPPGTPSDSAICQNSNNAGKSFGSYLQTISNTLLFVLGAVAVITIIIAGVRYTTSHGDPKAVQVAKDTLLYAVIGIIVALMAYAIVSFVVTQLPK